MTGSRPRLRWRLRAPLVVAGSRLRAHPARAVLVVIGVAASCAAILGVLGGSVVAQDRAVQVAVATLPAAERTFRVDAYGLPQGQSYAAANRTVRSALRPLAPTVPLRAVFLRELRIDHELVQLAGFDGIAGVTRLRAGRLPWTCVPERCEVVQVGTGGAAALDEAGIHLVRVGTVDLRDRAVFGNSLETQPEGGELPTLLLAAGARAFDRLPALDGVFRVYGWIAPLTPRRLHVWEISRVLAAETRAQARLARYGEVYTLSGPDQALLQARDTGRVAAHRMVLVGGEASALLLGFVLVAAIGLRRGLAGERRRLVQRGATRLQVWLAAIAEIGAMTLVGTALGVALGAAAVVVLASHTRSPVSAVLGHSLRTPLGLALVVSIWLVATGGALAAARLRDEENGGRRVRPLDVAALGAAGAAVVGLARGGLNADALSSGGSRTLLVLLPGLVCFVAAVAAGRLLRPLMRLAERASRSSPPVPRLALLALARAPARTAVTAAFLLVSLGLAFFAASWRATIERGARDEAAFAVPLDFTLTEGSRLVLPLEAAHVRRYSQLAPAVRAYPVLRRTAAVAGPGSGVLSPTVLGLPPAALAGLHWRSDFSDRTPSTLARRIAPDGSVTLRGASLPAGARAVSVHVQVRGVAVAVDLVAETIDHVTMTLPLGEKGPGRWTLAARLPQRLRQVVGVEISLATAEQLGYSHREAEAEEATAPAGTLELGPLRAADLGGNEHVVTDWSGWGAHGGARFEAGPTVRVSYAFTAGQTMLLRLPQATDGRALPVIASPEIARSAGPGGLLSIDFEGVQVPARITAVAARFPASEDQEQGFVVVDERSLATALDSGAPGTGTPGELWLSAPGASAGSVADALRRAPFDTLVVSSRADLERSLARDPLARGITLALGSATLIALVLAVVGFWVGLVSELRDEHGELFDLEAAGIAPSTLRRQFRLRAATLASLGVLGGLGLGLGLSRLVVSVVRISGVGGAAEPPLLLEPAWAAAGVGLALLVAVLALVVELTTRHAFRGDSPERASWSLE